MENLSKRLQLKAEIVKHLGEATGAMLIGEQSSLVRVLFLHAAAARYERGDDVAAEEALQVYTDVIAAEEMVQALVDAMEMA